jgi:hypothetical protein
MAMLAAGGMMVAPRTGGGPAGAGPMRRVNR